MEKVYKNFIDDDNQTGLYLMGLPTGIGKTYLSLAYLATKCIETKEYERIFFLTTSHKNLPHEDMAKLLKENGEDNVIKIESYQENILANFDKTKIPEEFQNFVFVKNMEKAINSYQRIKENNGNANDPDYIENKRNKLNETEKEFRKGIYKEIIIPLKHEIAFGKNMPKSEISKHIYMKLKNDIKYQWIGKFYPNIFVKDYKIVFMTVKKFLTFNQPFFEEPYSFCNGDISKNSLIILDEYDATKAVINDTYIEQALRNANDYLDFVERIVNKFLNYKKDLPKTVISAMESKPTDFQDILSNANNIYSTHKIYKKYYCNSVNGRNFLFNDFSYHNIFMDNSKNSAIVYENLEANNMTIELVNSHESEASIREESTNLFLVIRHLSVFVRRFSSFMKNISKTYTQIKNYYLKPEEQLSEEQGLESLLHCFGLTDQEVYALKENISFNSAKQTRKQSKFIKNNNYYERGMKTYEFANKASNSESTSFNYVEIDNTAEALLANLATKSKVIGISATANIDSVLSNYSFKYLNSVLGENLHYMSDKQIEYIRNYYNNLNHIYKTEKNPNGDIEVVLDYVDKTLFSDGNDITQSYRKILSERKYIKKLDVLLTGIGNNFKIKRYLSVAYVFKQFITNQEMRSFLCFTKKIPKKNSDFDLDIVSKIFDLIIKENNIEINSNYYVVLNSTGEQFDIDKEKILERLGNGEKIFVMTSYATLGAGQNMGYLIKKLKDLLINLTNNINPNDKRNQYKDFDGIYLGEITHVVTNLYEPLEKFTLESLYKYIVELENLYENDEISFAQLNKGIKDGFIKLSNPEKEIYSVLPHCFKSKIGYISKEVIQAIGRLNRTFNKKEKVYIFFSKNIFDYFDTSLLEKEILTPEVEQLAMYIKNNRTTSIDVDDKELKYKAEHLSYQARQYIYELLSRQWTDESINYYDTIGEYVLKSPTCSKKEHDKDSIFREYYIELKEKCNSYFFAETGDFTEIRISFEKDKDAAYRELIPSDKQNSYQVVKQCCELNARLQEVLKYKGMKEHFKDKGYALEFKPNDYILSPILFQNFYKGRLGEVAGKYILETMLNIQLQRLETEIFEFFDYKLCEGIYIDFKHWRANQLNATEYIKKINGKLSAANGKKAYIINLFDEPNGNNQITVSCDGRIIEVPYLINKGTYDANLKIIEMLEEDLLNEQ